MSAINAVQRVLSADNGVTAKVGNRIWFIEAPQQSQLPAIVLHMVSEIDGRHLLGSNRYPVARFIVDSLGTTYQAADELGDAVSYALIDYRGTVPGFAIDDIGADDLEIFDHGQGGEIVRRRLGFAMRYKAVEP